MLYAAVEVALNQIGEFVVFELEDRLGVEVDRGEGA